MARERAGISRLTALTPAEQELLRLLAQGLDNQAIATTLSLPRPAVNRNISAIYRKLELPRDPALNRRVLAARRHLAR